MRPWSTVTSPADPHLLIAGLGLALVPTALAYISYFTGVSHIKETSKVPVLASVEIIVASLIGFMFLGESIGIVNRVGIVLVLVSILIMSRTAPNSETIPGRANNGADQRHI